MKITKSTENGLCRKYPDREEIAQYVGKKETWSVLKSVDSRFYLIDLKGVAVMGFEAAELALNMLFFLGMENNNSIESECGPMTVQCCICKRVREGQLWVDLGLTEIEQANTSHGYCPVCAAKAFAEIHAYYAQKGQEIRKAASF